MNRTVRSRKSSIVLMVLLLFSIGEIMIINSTNVYAFFRTLVVPDYYSSINAAISDASAGDTVLVRKGVYYENVVVDKSVVLMAEVGEVIVVGEGGVERGGNFVFSLASDNVTLMNFDIQSSNYSSDTFYASGINVHGNNCKIIDNRIEGTYYGIFCSVQSSTVISGNEFDSVLKDGIRICGGSGNLLEDNVILNSVQSGIAIDGYLNIIRENLLVGNGRGIGLGSSYSVVFGNVLKENTESGFYVAASNCMVVSNNITKSKWGVYFTSYFASPNNNTFYQNNFIENAWPVGTSSVCNKQIWDNGKSGNYWGSFESSDANNDGICDSAYTVIGQEVDKYPLTRPCELLKNVSQPPLPSVRDFGKGLISLWNFDEVGPNGVTPDSMARNPIVLEASGETFTPVLVDGKAGKALQFNGTDYAYLTSSQSLNINSDFTVDAWINLQSLKNVTYNNILVECMRTTDKYPTRIFGFAVNGEEAENSSCPPLGALRGFFLDDKGIFNEIATTNAVVVPNEWIHVILSRSTYSGMHIYVNGLEQAVIVTNGVQNSSRSIAQGTEFYIGHDSMITIDELSLRSVAVEGSGSTQLLLLEWWFSGTVIVCILLLLSLALWLRKNHRLAC